MKQYNIVFIGDSKSGKSSILEAIRSGSFVEDVPSVSESYKVSEETTLSHCPFVLYDTSSDLVDKVDTQSILRKSDVVVFVAFLKQKGCEQSFLLQWVPILQLVCPKTPIMVVASQVDLFSDEERKMIRSFLSNALSNVSNVEVCLECSAKNHYNIDELLRYGEKLAAFPISPLLNRTTNQLTPKCIRMCSYVFRYFNKSHTLFLSNDELSSFNEHCYGSPLTSEGILSLHQMLEQQGILVPSQGLSESNFLELMKLFLLHDHPENVWLIFQALNFHGDYPAFPPISIQKDALYCLSPAGKAFLMDLFKRYDQDGDHKLSRGEIEWLMRVVNPLPWNAGVDLINPGFPANLPESSQSFVEPTAWICEWELMIRVSTVSTIQALYQLGGSDVSRYIQQLPESVETWKLDETPERKVIHAFLFGSHGVGKSSILRRFLGHSPAEIYLPDTRMKTAVNLVKHGSNVLDTLILTEVPEEETDRAFHLLKKYGDLVCLVWDATRLDSLEFVIQLGKKLPRGTKVLMIATKSDLLQISYEKTDGFSQSHAFTSAFGLEDSLLTSQFAKDRLFPVMFDIAVTPEICELEKEEEAKSFFWPVALWSLAIGVVVGGMILYRRRH